MIRTKALFIQFAELKWWAKTWECFLSTFFFWSSPSSSSVWWSFRSWNVFYCFIHRHDMCCDIWLISVSMGFISSKNLSLMHGLEVSHSCLYLSLIHSSLSMWINIYKIYIFQGVCVSIHATHFIRLHSLCDIKNVVSGEFICTLFDLKHHKRNGHTFINHVTNVIYFMVSVCLGMREKNRLVVLIICANHFCVANWIFGDFVCDLNVCYTFH